MKYDLPTLLALRRNARFDIRKFNPQVLGSNLLRQRENSNRGLSVQQPNRPVEPLSKNESRAGSSASSNKIGQPRRQPSNPPPEPLSQLDAGFAKFLKEHASPKHQRVTAGGRIVPMDTTSVPTNPRFSAKEVGKNTDQMSPLAVSKQIETENPPAKSSTKDSEMERHAVPLLRPPSASASGIDPTKLAKHGHNKLDQEYDPGKLRSILQAVSAPFPTFQFNGYQTTNSQQTTQEGQKAFEPQPISPSEVPYGFAGHQSAWPRNVLQAWGAPSQAMVYPFASTHSQMTSSSSSSFAPGTSSFSLAPIAFNFNFPVVLEEQSQAPESALHHWSDKNSTGTGQQLPDGLHWQMLQDAVKIHNSLSAELSQLDRYMAMHTFDLNAKLKTLLVERRIGLVREIDSVRLRKEHLESVTSANQANVPNSLAQPVSQFQTSNYQSTNTLANPVQLPGVPDYFASYSDPVFPSSILVNGHVSTSPEPLNVASHCGSAVNQLYFGPNLEPSNEGVKAQTPVGAVNRWSSGNGLDTDQNFSLVQLQAPSTTTCRRTDLDVQGLSDEWARRWTTPPEIRRIYHKIEIASSQGLPIDSLLQELAIVTEKMNNKSVNEHPLRKRLPHDELGSSMCQASRADVSYTAKAKQPKTDGFTDAEAENTQKTHQPAKGQIGRLKQELRSRRKLEGMATRSLGSEGVSNSSSTCAPWTDVRSSTEAESRETSLAASTADSRLTVRVHRDGKLAQSTRIEKPPSPVNVLFRPTAGRLQSPRLSKVPRTLKGDGREILIRKRMLTRYSGIDASPFPQKSFALAVPQTINVHAFLPRFNIENAQSPCDGFSSTITEAYFSSERCALSTQENSQQPTASMKTQWVQKMKRQRPSQTLHALPSAS